jgi:hypothetical protein
LSAHPDGIVPDATERLIIKQLGIKDNWTATEVESLSEDDDSEDDDIDDDGVMVWTKYDYGTLEDLKSLSSFDDGPKFGWFVLI